MCLLNDEGGLACALSLSLMQELIRDGKTELPSSPPSYYDPDQKKKTQTGQTVRAPPP